MAAESNGATGAPAVVPRPHPPARRRSEPPPIVHENDIIRCSGKNKDEWRSVGVRVAAAAGGTGVAAMRAIAPSAVYCAVRAFIHARGLVAVRGLDLQCTAGYSTIEGHDGAILEAITLYCWSRREDLMHWEEHPNGE